MWEQYKKTLIPTQVAIFGFCAALAYLAKIPPIGLVFFFVMMQGCAFIGAAWAWRLKNKIRRSRDSLPLQPR